MAKTYVALLRGVNLAGKNRLPMKDLAEMFKEAGCSNVETYIQSGNVVFTASSKLAAGIPALIAAEIAKRFGYRTPVVLRSVEQLREVVQGNPFLKAGAAEDTLHVSFLADFPNHRGVKELDPNRCPPDAFCVLRREVYLQLPNGAGRTKLNANYFDSKLGTIGTQRNWRTVVKLLELMGG